VPGFANESADAVRGAAPPVVVRRAFGVDGAPVLLAGGEGRSWRCGDAVLKWVGGAPQFSWIASVLSEFVTPASIIVPRPVVARSGMWVADGWSCTEYVDAQPQRGRWQDIIAAGRSFHACLADLPRPPWMDDADDWWRRGDAVAWDGREPVGPEPYLELVHRLLALVRPIDLASQIVHGDLCGNVLFDPAGRPVVIDFSPYWRPLEFASAIVAIDAFEWEGAGPGALTWLDDVDPSHQLLLRAALYRIATSADIALADGVDPRKFTVDEATVDTLTQLLG
jgi:uncharacterized protein (TIGR02569 family)